MVALLEGGAAHAAVSQDGSTALHFASRSGRTATVAELLRRGAG